MNKKNKNKNHNSCEQLLTYYNFKNIKNNNFSLNNNIFIKLRNSKNKTNNNSINEKNINKNYHSIKINFSSKSLNKNIKKNNFSFKNFNSLKKQNKKIFISPRCFSNILENNLRKNSFFKNSQNNTTSIIKDQSTTLNENNINVNSNKNKKIFCPNDISKKNLIFRCEELKNKTKKVLNKYLNYLNSKNNINY